jgi:hypothetical protein
MREKNYKDFERCKTFIMKNRYCVLLLLFITTFASAQNKKEIGIALVNAASAYPFSKLGNLVTEVSQPGIEASYGFNLKTKSRNDWYQQLKFGWLYHRFVQNAFSLYTNVGYRYKFSPHWSAHAAIGAGYLHSIPATAKLKLNNNGEYKNDKGIGRAQAMAVLNFSPGYIPHPMGARPLKIFITYQQLIQTPFVKAYVPILPYNSLLIGASIPLPSPKK